MSLSNKRNASEFPQEAISKRSSKQEESDSDQDSEEANTILQETSKSWSTPQGQYNIQIKLCKNYEYPDDLKDVYAKLTLNQKEIGKMSGSIISRPTRYSFFEIGDSSQELNELTLMFCDAKGRCNRIVTGLEPTSVYRGGFFHIERVEIDVEQKGNDLGLRLLSEVFTVLKDMWVIAVLKACPLNDHYLSRMNIDLDNEEDNTRIYYATEESKEKIGRHWSRLGFQQSGRSRNQCSVWYLTSNHYWNDIVDASDNNCKWRIKEAVKDLDIFKPPPIYHAQGADQELADLIHKRNTMDKATLKSKIDHLIKKRGATLHGSRVLFILAANEDHTNDTMDLLSTLIQYNHSDAQKMDENKNTPLHVAASKMNLAAMKWLVHHGADKNVKNADGHTPLQCLETCIRNIQDFRATFGLIYFDKPSQMEKQHQCLLLLMKDSEKRQLIDGWMSPRMLLALKISAELGYDMIGDLDGVSFQKFKPTPLSECCGLFGIHRIEHIPPTTLCAHNPDGLYKSFVDGWQIVWGAIMTLLQRNLVPTKTRVENEVVRLCCEKRYSYDSRKWQHFQDKGGKIEYALDAILYQTRNICVDGDDGWEYDIFEDQFNALDATPLDLAFDLARVKILELTDENMNQQPRGPYRYVFEEEEEEDEDEYTDY
ncbi:hypothetical protein CTEN210_14191 [Chaetoceros tenuissimus]|uniref:Uncharacterized protein n=1 Tax=Chaetoceros tenuissimus TaxID=426638 RepID=A0AAD3D718_9STRA|nr:hypothetical protein CTEN210_14191 [Chaetoceros tenuissimus]